MFHQINVGILAQKTIQFKLNGIYKLKADNNFYEGDYELSINDNQIFFNNKFYTQLAFEPESYNSSSFELKNVCIGIQFHWERIENQIFKGIIRFVLKNDLIQAVNNLPVEDYLESVISSEMNAENPLELLKAHAVISRSWILAQLQKKQAIMDKKYDSSFISENEIIKWYDREDHEDYDVCSDDHCQRYQGITRISAPEVIEAVASTKGEVLMFEEMICDTRFSKCCGGITEEFENCWEPQHFTYLSSVACDNSPVPEQKSEDWILSSPPAFCNTNDKVILSRILNDYDRETNDFYRWKVIYSQKELSTLMQKKSGIDFGEIVDLIPCERGKSGRIVRLLIQGTKKTMYVGKELEIRKYLSETHLYSSAFVVEKNQIINEIPHEFILHGAGWGHGVGLCQIGAAVMASKGFDYQEILKHYFEGANIVKL